jgi:hypothetical protein
LAQSTRATASAMSTSAASILTAARLSSAADAK